MNPFIEELISECPGPWVGTAEDIESEVVYIGEDEEMIFYFSPRIEFNVHENLTYRWVYAYINEVPIFLGRYYKIKPGLRAYQTLKGFRDEFEREINWSYTSKGRYFIAKRLWEKYEEERVK